MQPLILVIFGPPGVGKGTLSDMLAKKYKILHISPGDIFREEIKNGNSELIQYVERGLLVPNSIVNKVIEKALKKEEYRNGFILDGYPRTIDQSEFLENVLWTLNKKITLILNFTANEEILVERLTKRRMCSQCKALYNLLTMPPRKKDICDKCSGQLVQRKDDAPETIKKRIQVYSQETAPLIEYYKKKKILRDVDGSRKPKEVLISVVSIIKSLSH